MINNGNGSGSDDLDFRRSVKLRAIDEFPSKDVPAILAFVLEQRVPGELVISLPGNGGITGICFRGKERTRPGEIIEVEQPEK